MFNVGEKVVYPMYGAGIIESIEDMKIFEVRKKCYIIKMLIEDIKVIIPIDNIGALGIRPLSDYKVYLKTLEILSGPCAKMEEKWNIRYRKNELKIKKGEIIDIAIIVNYLAHMNRFNRLSTGEQKMLHNAYQILNSELSLIKDISLAEMEKIIDETLNFC